MALPVDDSPAPPQVRRLSSPSLIGRARPLNTLLTLWAQVRAGAGALALVEGEAGVGKTRLLHEFCARALKTDDAGTLLAGHCFEPDQSVPYAPIADLLRTLYASLDTAARHALFGRYAGDLAPLLPELADRVPGVQGLNAESTTDQRRLWHSLTQLLTQHAQTRPLVIIIEDVHWADPASLAFIQYLSRRVPAHPWLLLLSLRPNPIGPALTQLLTELERDHTAIDVELAPLSAAATRQLVRALLAPAKPPAQLVETVYGLSEGNPFFVEELVRAWMTSADRQRPGAMWDAMALRLPRSLRATVQHRLSELGVEAGKVLQLAAVIGRRFDFPLLLHLTGLSEPGLLVHLRALVQAQLVAEESADSFVFRHTLTREAVYRDLLERERLALHRTILGGLETLHPEPKRDRVMADLAFHAYQSGAWAKAMNYAQAVAHQAQALHAPDTAVEHFTYAILSAQRLDLVPPPALYQARGRMYELLGQFEPACSDYELALATARQLRDTVAECQGLLDLGFLWTGRDYARAGGYFDEAVALARPLGQPALLATTLNRVGLSHTHAERPLVGLRHHVEALAVYRAEADLAGQAETLDLLGVTAFMAGDLALGWHFFEEGITLCRRTGDRQRLATLLFTGALRGGGLLVDTLAWLPVPSEACLRECAEAIQITQAIPWPAGEAYAHIIHAHLLGVQGQIGAALAAAQSALQLAESIEHAMWTLNAHVALGALFLELLRPDLALPHLENAPAEAQALGSTYMTYLSASYLSRCYLAQKQAGQAAEALMPC